MYRITTLRNEWMKLAYNIAKQHYAVGNWNKKTTPVAVIVSSNGKYISHGSCADGKHAILGTCKRLETKGSDYSDCPYCHEFEHAERKAVDAAGVEPLLGAVMYLYGHYRVCEHCLNLLNSRGIVTIYLLEDAHTLFDRHNANTVIGKPSQFIV